MLSDCASRSLNSQLVAAPQSGAYSIRSNRGASENLHVSFALFSVQTHLSPARPNQPINRTYCGRRRLGFRFTLAQTPPAAIGRLSATLDMDYHRQRHTKSDESPGLRQAPKPHTG